MAVMTSVNDNREYEQKMIINAISQLGRATIEKCQACGRASLMLYGALVCKPQPIKMLPDRKSVV